nr:type II toxin-antitoxin system HicB family antitoxin [uncultured Brevundimonas sp.]
MAKEYYVAVLERGLNDSFGVFFPDLPGCVSAGRTADEAIRDAREALALHIEGLIEDGQPLPAASSASAFTDDDFPGSAVEGLILVPVDITSAPREKPERINVSLLPSLVSRVDDAAKHHGLTRSGLLSVAARHWLAANRVQNDADAHSA